MIESEIKPLIYALGDKYSERRIRDEQLKQMYRNEMCEGIEWGQNMGDYFRLFGDHQKDYAFRRSPYELVGEEVVLNDVISHIILNGGVTFVDFGGMLGASWCRIAKRHEDSIAAGMVKFVVTNLNMSREQIRTNIGRQDIYFPPSDMIVFKESSDLVQYENLDAAGMWEKYKGKVDLIHEQSALIHSLQPDTDILMLAQCISPKGVLIVNSKGYNFSNSLYSKEVNEGFEFGFNNAGQVLTEVNSGSKPAAKIFRGEDFNESIFDKDFPGYVE